MQMVSGPNRKSVPVIIAGIIILAILCFISGCGGTYGRLTKSSEATRVFEDYQVLADHQYYFYGPEGRVEAILAVARDYTLETSLWTAVKPTTELLKQWVEGLNFHFRLDIRHDPHGAYMVDPKGKQLGLWYSIWDGSAITIVLKGNNRFSVYPPVEFGPFKDGGDDDDNDDRG